MEPRAEDASDRRQEILATALQLLAEEGYAGASLRKLAARLDIAQPSLYHYFRTKEDLVEQVLAKYAGEMFAALRPEHIPTQLEQVPRAVVETVVRVYERPTHPLFVRVAISVSRTHERFGALMRRVFVEQASLGIELVMQPFVQAGDIAADDAQHLVRMLINSVGLRLVEDRVMFERQDAGSDLQDYVDFVIDAGEALVQLLRQHQHEQSGA